jgi:hypothetical protein
VEEGRQYFLKKVVTILVVFDTSKTLNELEKNVLKWQTDFQSGLVQRCLELRDVKLEDFSAEDMRLMIGQGIGLKYIVPLALEILTDNPFIEGDFYRGDLLIAVIKVEQEFWSVNQDLKHELDEIVDDVKHSLATIAPVVIDYK